jgi:hypothetical protein
MAFHDGLRTAPQMIAALPLSPERLPAAADCGECE